MPSDFLHKGENTSHYGSNDQVACELSITRNLEGDQTERGTITYHQAGEYDAVVALIPKLGSTSQYFKNGAVLQTVNITSEPSNVWKVVLTYFNPTATNTDIGISGSARDNSLSVSMETRSLLLNPKFTGISEPFLFYLGKLMNGGSPTDLVAPFSESGELEPDADKITIDEAFSRGVDQGLISSGSSTVKCYELMKRGVVSYLASHIEWTETEYTSSQPSSSKLSKIGTRSSPTNAPKFGNRNWLLTGISSTADRDSSVWKTTYTYSLSDEGAEWNSDIYD